jgi:menaquinone-9 beta-reductase
MFDVVIVGAGPAGTSTALHLVRRERVDPHRILVLDKATFPRDKPCAGAVSAFGLDVLARIGIVATSPSVPLRGVRLIDDGDFGESVVDGMGIAIRRTDFDAELLAEARADGVRIREGEGIRAIERTDDGFRIVTTTDAIVACRLLAACDGAGSTTRKLLGVREADRKGHLYVLDTEAASVDRGVARGLADFDLGVRRAGIDGYYWDFPTVLGGERAVSRGIYHANIRPARVKEALAGALADRGFAIADVKLRPFSTRPFVRRSVTWVPGALLVGEACGIDRATGEGIAQSIDMGRIAAHHLAASLLERRFSDFSRYDRALRASTTGQHLLQSALLARWVYGRYGAPARSYLLASSYARGAAMKWYRGERLALGTKLRLGVGLAAAALSGSPAGIRPRSRSSREEASASAVPRREY